MTTYCVLDGTNLSRRAYHAGGTSMLHSSARRMKERFGATVMVAWDAAWPCWRYDLFPEYKAGRRDDPAASEFVRADARAWKASGGIGYYAEGMEADDVAATIAARVVLAGDTCVLVSSDKDWAQLIRPGVTLIAPGDWAERGEEWVQQKFGCAPALIPDYIGIAGDASDGLPGVKGLGPIAARSLLAQFGDLPGIYEGLSLVSETLRRRLEEHRETAFLCRSLACLRDDCDLLEIAKGRS